MKSNYVFIRKDKIIIDETHIVCLLRFEDDEMPKLYIFDSMVWNNPNEVFVDRRYDKTGQKSKPEWGINYSKKNIHILDQYKEEEFFYRS